MKVALFGGTFDPIHNGHLNAAREVLKQGLVEEVWFIPVYWHALKENTKVSELRHRKEMIGLAIANEKGLKLIDLNENPTYTIDTILKVEELSPENEYFWLIGTNLVQEFSSWKEPEKVLQEVKLILFPVPGSESEKNELVDSSSPIRVQAREIDLSSTVVREKLRRGEAIAALVPKAVGQYIKENSLY